MLSILDPKWRVFMKVAQLGSLTKAANVLDVPQSMVSRHIAQLESQCSARLFRRTGRGVVLTDFGEQILPRLQELINEAEVLEDAILTSKGNPIGEVKVGLLPSMVSLIASRLFALVHEQYPLVQLHLSEGPSAQLEEQLKEGRLDMATLLREGSSVATDETVLSQPSLRLVGPAGDPILGEPTVKLKQVHGLPLVVPSRPHPLRAHLDFLSKREKVHFNCVIEADSIHLQHEIVAAGGGYAITSGLFELHDDGRLASSRIVEPELIRSVVLGTTLRRPGTLATRRIQQLIEREVPPLLDF